MKQVPDRKRLRREYLRRKYKAYVGIILFGTSVFATGLLAIVCCAKVIIAYQTTLADHGSLSSAETTLGRQLTVCQGRLNAETPQANLPGSDGTCYSDAYREHDRTLARLSANETAQTAQIWILGALGLVAACSAVWCRLELRRVAQMARVPYIPPVTAATLPAEEILVRGSEEPPVAQSEVLLRAAAAKRQETPKDELLRISQGEWP